MSVSVCPTSLGAFRCLFVWFFKNEVEKKTEVEPSAVSTVQCFENINEKIFLYSGSPSSSRIASKYGMMILSRCEIARVSLLQCFFECVTSNPSGNGISLEWQRWVFTAYMSYMVKNLPAAVILIVPVIAGTNCTPENASLSSIIYSNIG